jgi:co-chaperonin GroES (HSP10)
MKIIPLNKRVIVDKPESLKRKREGLIEIPESAYEHKQESARLCRVLALGEGITEPVRQGDTILVGEFAGHPIPGTKMFIIGEGDIMGVVENLGEDYR